MANFSVPNKSSNASFVNRGPLYVYKIQHFDLQFHYRLVNLISLHKWMTKRDLFCVFLYSCVCSGTLKFWKANSVTLLLDRKRGQIIAAEKIWNKVK